MRVGCKERGTKSRGIYKCILSHVINRKRSHRIMLGYHILTLLTKTEENINLYIIVMLYVCCTVGEVLEHIY